MQNNPVRVGIIGTGSAAKAHAQALKSIDGAIVTGISGLNLDKAIAFADELSIKNVYKSAQDLINSKEIDAVILAVVPDAQPEIAVSAFNNKKHVLCEKPLAVRIEDAQKIYEAWERSDSIGMINFCYRLIPQVKMLKEYIDNGICGQINQINVEWILSNRLNPNLTYHWKGQKENGGGVLSNFGVHVLDYIFYGFEDVKLLGSKLDTVFKKRFDDLGQEKDCTGDEVFTALFEVKNGCAVVIHISLVTSHAEGHKITVRGSKGTVEVYNKNPKTPGGPFYLRINGIEKQNNMVDEFDKYDLSSLFHRVDSLFIKSIYNKDRNAEPSILSGLKVNKLLDQFYFDK